MTQPSKRRTHWINIRLSVDEFELLLSHFKDSTHRNVSAYVRHIILQKPVNIKHRNASVDDFLTDMLSLKKELKLINDNNKTALEKLDKLRLIGDFEQWIIANEADKITISKKIDAIQARIIQLYKIWSQE